VKDRIDKDNFTAVTDIDTFAERIKSGAGKSTNLEIVKERSSMGGNGPIMADSLSLLGNIIDIADRSERTISFRSLNRLRTGAEQL
jgi:hypothetical protein